MVTVVTDLRALLEGLSEAALIAAGDRVIAANDAARALLGASIDGHCGRAGDLPSGRDRGTRKVGDQERRRGRADRPRRIAPPLADAYRAPCGRNPLIRFVDRSEVAAAEQMRVDFVANASHELRTPLSTLIGYTETLREQADEIDPATRERFLAVVHDEARRMQRVVEDLISLSRIEAEKFTDPDRSCRPCANHRSSARRCPANGG